MSKCPCCESEKADSMKLCDMCKGKLCAVQADIDLERIMHEWATVDAQAREAYARKRELGAELAGFAEDKRETQNTVHLTAHDGLTLKVEFRAEEIVDYVASGRSGYRYFPRKLKAA